MTATARPSRQSKSSASGGRAVLAGATASALVLATLGVLAVPASASRRSSSRPNPDTSSSHAASAGRSPSARRAPQASTGAATKPAIHLAPATPRRAACPVPGAPPSASATAGANQATVTWTAADGMGTALTGYVITAHVGTGTGPAVATGPAALTVVLSGLVGGSSTTFTVVATSSCGTGAAATTTAVTPTGAASTYASTVLADSPTAYYRLGEAPGSTLMADSSTAGRIGSFNANAVTLGQPGAIAGDPDTAVSTNANGPVGYAAPTLAIYNQPRSVEVWVKPADGNFRYVAGWGTQAYEETFNVGVSSTQVGVVSYNDDHYFNTGRSLVDGSWHHIVVTYDSASVVAFLDGQSLGSQSFAGPLNTLNGSNLVVGGYANGCCDTYGGLDDVAIYPTALTAARVAAHFTASAHSRPSAPHFVTAAYGGPNGINVSWGIATATNGPIQGYLVQGYIGTKGANAVAVAGDKTAARLTGLAGGTAYSFKVKAFNAYGSGPLGASGTFTVTGAASTYASTVLSNRPSAFYRLGETSGSIMADSSGGGANGGYNLSAVTLGQPGAVIGDPDTSVSDNANAPVAYAAPTLPVYNQARSVEVWTKPADTNTRYLAGWGTNSTTQGFDISANATQIGVLGYNDDLTFTTGHALNDGAWHHIVVTYDTAVVTVYLDGLSLGSQTPPSPYDTINTSGLVVGGYHTGCTCSYGGLDEFAVYPAALTAAQVAAHFAANGYSRPGPVGSLSATAGANQVTLNWTAATATGAAITSYFVQALLGPKAVNATATGGNATSVTVSGLVGGSAYTFTVQAFNAYGSGPKTTSPAATPTGAASTYASTVLSNRPSAFYRLGETSGSIMADSSGGGANGGYNLSAVTLGQPGAVIGDPDTSVSDNANAPVAYAAPTLPVYNQARSVEVWTKPADTNTRYLAGWGTNSTTQGFDISANATQIGVLGYNDDLTFTTGHALNDGAWHHIVVTYDTAVVTVYLDGLSLGSQTPPSPYDTINTSGLVVGGYHTGCTCSYGGLDEFAVYPAALTAAQVAAHFAANGYSRPGPVGSLSATAGANQVTLNWTAATATGAAITSYFVQALLGPKAVNATATGGNATSVTVSGLVGGSAYTFTVQAFNAYGSGPKTTSPAATPTGAASTYASTVLSNRPSAFYRLGETSGSIMADSSGGGANGGYNLSAVTLGQPGAVIGDPDTSVSDNANAPVAYAAPTLPVYNQARSVEVWTKPADTNTRYLAGWGTNSTTQGFDISANATQIGVLGYNDDLTFTTGHALNDGAWHHIVVTYDTVVVTVYLDGLSLGSQTPPSPYDTINTSGLVVGGYHTGCTCSYGGLDEFAVYPAALTAAQVAAHFHAAGYKPRRPRSVVVANVLVPADRPRRAV